jgi:hypothetical protein
MAEALSTGDVIFLAVVPDVAGAGGTESESEPADASYLHAEGYADCRLGTADKYDSAQRAYCFRECLFEVTNQLQYGAQQELLEYKKKFLAAIYKWMKDIDTQLAVVSRLLDDETTRCEERGRMMRGRGQSKDVRKMPEADHSWLASYKQTLTSYHQVAEVERNTSERDFEDGGLKVRKEVARIEEAKQLRGQNRGWSALVGGWKPGQASNLSTFPHRLGPFGLAGIDSGSLPQFTTRGPGEEGTGILTDVSIIYYSKPPDGWQSEWGKCECECSGLDKVTFAPQMKSDLGIDVKAEFFTWVYPCKALKELNDQSKISLARQSAQNSLLAFGGFAYFKSTPAEEKFEILNANAFATAAHKQQKRKLAFCRPKDIPKHVMDVQKRHHKFQPVTSRSIAALAPNFCWVGPGKGFGTETTEHGGFVYECIKGEGLWFDIAAGSRAPQKLTRSSSKRSTAQLLSQTIGDRRQSATMPVGNRVTRRQTSASAEMFDAAGLTVLTELNWKDWDAKIRYMSERVKKERDKNEHDSHRQCTVSFGQPIQLKHVKSGKFLEVKTRDGSPELASIEKQCYRLQLTENGSEGSWFHFQNRLAQQDLGGFVGVDGDVLVQSNTLSNFQLHTSRALAASQRTYLAFDSHRCEVNLGSYDIHLKSQHPPDDDVRGTPQPGEPDDDPTAVTANGGFVWKLHRYSRSDKHIGIDKNRLTIGQALRLYHPHAEAYICASSDKGAKAVLNQDVYLQPLGSNGHGSFNPDDGSNQSTKQVFLLESGDCVPGNFKQQGGAVSTRSAVRLRHVASGKYLMVDFCERRDSFHQVADRPDDGSSVVGKPVLVHLSHLCQQPQAEKNKIAWENTQFHLIPTARPEDQTHSDQHEYIPISADFRVVLVKGGPWERGSISDNKDRNVCLTTSLVKKERKLHHGISDGAGKRKSISGSVYSSFDQEKSKGISMHFSNDDTDIRCNILQSSVVTTDFLQLVEKTLAERAGLRAFYTPGPWGKQGQLQSMLQLDPREAELQATTLLRRVISELLGNR